MRKIAFVACVAAVAMSATSALGSVVLKNAPWATSSVVTNGMGAAHDKMPANVTNFTIEAWVKPSTSVSGSGNFMFSVIKDAALGRIVFSLVSNELRCYYYGSWYRSYTNVALNVWSHVAVVRSPDGFDFYINGEHVGETADYISPDITKTAEVATDAVPAIGCQRTGVNNARALADTGNRVFQGSISDVRMWTTARTAGEIAATMGTRLTGQEDGLYLYVPFTDGKVGESVVKNVAEGYDLIVPPTQELAWDSEIDSKFGVAPTPPWNLNAATSLTSLRHSRAKIRTDVKLTNTTYTLEAWARLDFSDTSRQYLLGQYVQGDQATWVGLVVASQKPQFFIGSGSNSPITSDTSVTVGEWFHVAGTRDENGVVRLYLNGAEVGRGMRDASFGPPPDDVFELFNTGANASISGSLREVRVWERARSAAEIAASYRTTVTNTEEGLVGRWPLDECTGSRVRNAVTGAWNTLGQYATDNTLAFANMGFTWAPAAVLTSSFANNSGSRIQTDVKIATSDFTVETWARVETIPSSLCYLMGQYMSGNKDTWFSLIFDNALPRFRNGSDGTGKTISSSVAITAGRWFHLAATREGTAMKLYLNGAQVATGTANTSDPPPNANFQLFTTGGNKTWGGDLREARVWNYARTQEQIVAAMNDPAEGMESGLLGSWAMDEGAGATAISNKVTGTTHLLSQNNSWLTEQSSAPALSEPEVAPYETELAPEFGGAWFGMAYTETAVDVQDFTFETWVRPTAFHYSQTYLLGQWTTGENNEQSGNAYNPSRFLMGFTETNHFGLFIGGADDEGNGGGWRYADETVPLNEWTHVAATRQGSTLRLYINGQLKKTIPNYTTRSPWNADKPHRLTLGGTSTFTAGYTHPEGRMLQGAMREVRVWNKALSALHISRIYNHKIDLAEETNLIGYWPLEKPNALDSSLLVNEAPEGSGETGYILSGWSRIPALNLSDPEPPSRTIIIFR